MTFKSYRYLFGIRNRIIYLPVKTFIPADFFGAISVPLVHTRHASQRLSLKVFQLITVFRGSSCIPEDSSKCRTPFVRHANKESGIGPAIASDRTYKSEIKGENKEDRNGCRSRVHWLTKFFLRLTFALRCNMYGILGREGYSLAGDELVSGSSLLANNERR